MMIWALGGLCGLAVVLATLAVWAICLVGGGADAHIEMMEEQERKQAEETINQVIQQGMVAFQLLRRVGVTFSEEQKELFEDLHRIRDGGDDGE